MKSAMEAALEGARDTSLEYREDTSRYLEQLDAQIADARAHIEMLETLRAMTNLALVTVTTEVATGSPIVDPEIQTALRRGNACAVRVGVPSEKWKLAPSAFAHDWVRIKLIEPYSHFTKLSLGPMGYIQRDRSPRRSRAG